MAMTDATTRIRNLSIALAQLGQIAASNYPIANRVLSLLEREISKAERKIERAKKAARPTEPTTNEPTF